MAKAQFPIDGKPGKAWKVTSKMGWRMHPVHKEKRHHNGTDIWAKAEPCWIEAPYDGKVINVGNNPKGFGNSVTLLHNIDGKPYVTLYAHMANGSVKVKKGQKVTAGTPLGKMGSTGVSTGKHLHWELQRGKKWVWNTNGKNFIEPVAFFDALIKKEAIEATAADVTPDDAPVAPAPTHDSKGAAELAKAEKPVPAKPAFKALKVGSRGAAVKKVQAAVGATADGIFGPKTRAAVAAFQTKNGLKATGVVDQATWNALG